MSYVYGHKSSTHDVFAFVEREPIVSINVLDALGQNKTQSAASFIIHPINSPTTKGESTPKPTEGDASAFEENIGPTLLTNAKGIGTPYFNPPISFLPGLNVFLLAKILDFGRGAFALDFLHRDGVLQPTMVVCLENLVLLVLPKSGGSVSFEVAIIFRWSLLRRIVEDDAPVPLASIIVFD